MPIRVDWHETEPTIRHWRFIGDWSWAELRQELAVSAPLVEVKGDRADAILDFSESKAAYSGWLAGLRGVAPKVAQNIHLVVVVTANPFILTVLRMFRGINPRPQIRLASAPSVTEALRLIQADRAAKDKPQAGV
jgi:hypothetical protein